VSKSNEVRTSYLKGLLDELYESLEKVENPDRVLISSKKKLNYRAEKVSNRRSRYTGVFKNGSKWQALIAIKMKKTYIHTYADEKEAAKAFDLMSILMKKYLATTNFDYTKRDILDLFNNFSDIVVKF